MPSNQLAVMYHSESSVHVYQTLMELCIEYLLQNPLVWGYIAREVIHRGIQRTLEQYFQECQRAGWDHLQVTVTLLHTSAQPC